MVLFGPGDLVVLQVQPAPAGGAMIWQGQVTVPAALQGRTVWLVVEESEQLIAENQEHSHERWVADPEFMWGR